MAFLIWHKTPFVWGRVLIRLSGPWSKLSDNLGEEIKQPSNPYANMANCGLHRSQLSTLHAILPDLEPDAPGLPRGAVDLSDGYVLLRA